jgi:threonine dehydratase
VHEPPGMAAVVAAAERIAPHIRRTPILAAELAGRPVLLKLENLQVSGSFKARGALNAVLATADAGAEGVVAASGGNHGLGVAYAAGRAGLSATIVVPDTVPEEKARRLDAAGAQVVRHGHEYAEAQDHAEALAVERGEPFIHPFADPRVVAGQGTVGLEILQDSEPDVILVAVGGGGLISGIAVAVEGRADVVGVEPLGIPTLSAALAAGRPVDVEIRSITASALGARRTHALNLELAQRLVREVVLVSDAEVLAARDMLWDTCRLAVEPAAAAGLAALVSGRVEAHLPCVVVCGANSAWAPAG